MKMHENIRTNNHGLFERMVSIAESVVHHNWSDVAIHDRRKLQLADVGDTFVWSIHEMGSYLSPLFARLDEQAEWEVHPQSPIQVLMVRWLANENQIDNDLWRKIYHPSNYQHYIVRKTGENRGVIDSVGFPELRDLAFCGQFHRVVGANE